MLDLVALADWRSHEPVGGPDGPGGAALATGAMRPAMRRRGLPVASVTSIRWGVCLGELERVGTITSLLLRSRPRRAGGRNLGSRRASSGFGSRPRGPPGATTIARLLTLCESICTLRRRARFPWCAITARLRGVHRSAPAAMAQVRRCIAVGLVASMSPSVRREPSRPPRARPARRRDRATRTVAVHRAGRQRQDHDARGARRLAHRDGDAARRDPGDHLQQARGGRDDRAARCGRRAARGRRRVRSGSGPSMRSGARSCATPASPSSPLADRAAVLAAVAPVGR